MPQQIRQMELKRLINDTINNGAQYAPDASDTFAMALTGQLTAQAMTAEDEALLKRTQELEMAETSPVNQGGTFA